MDNHKINPHATALSSFFQDEEILLLGQASLTCAALVNIAAVAHYVAHYIPLFTQKNMLLRWTGSSSCEIILKKITFKSLNTVA